MEAPIVTNILLLLILICIVAGLPLLAARMSEAHAGDPLWSRMLSERGLGTLLAVVLVGALLYVGVRFISDAQAFQTSMVAESARTNEKLEQLQIAHAQQAIQIDRIEALLIARSGP